MEIGNLLLCFVCLFYFIIGYFFFFYPTTQCQNLTEFSHSVSLVFLNLWQFLRLPLFFMTLTILKSKGQLFRGMTPIWMCLMFSLWKNGSSWLLGRIPQKWGVLLITSYWGGRAWQQHDLHTGGVDLDHLVHRFLWYKVTMCIFTLYSLEVSH